MAAAPLPGRHALVVCISVYDDEFLCPLPQAEKDAAAAVNGFLDLNFKVSRPSSDPEHPGRLELRDLRTAVAEFQKRVEEDARIVQNPVAAVVVACHGVQTNSHYPELLTSDWSSNTDPPAETFSVLRELFVWLEVVRTRGSVCTGLNCLLIFDCCRQSKTWGTEMAAPDHYPGWTSNFYLLYSCDPGGEARVEGGLVQKVMHLLQFSLPLSVVLFLSAQSFLARQALQRPWLEYKPGKIDPILGTKAYPGYPLSSVPSQDFGPRDPRCPLSVVVLGELGEGSCCDRLAQTLCPETALPTAAAPVVLGRVLTQTRPRARDIRMRCGTDDRQFRITVGANSVGDIAELTPPGVDIFLLNGLDWNHLQRLCADQSETSIAEILARTLEVELTDGIQPHHCMNTLQVGPQMYRSKSTLQVDLNEPSNTARERILERVVDLTLQKPAFDGEAFKTARLERLLLQQYVDQRLQEPGEVRDGFSNKLRTWMDDGSVKCSDCMRFVLQATSAQLEDVARRRVTSEVVSEVACPVHESDRHLAEHGQQELQQQDLRRTKHGQQELQRQQQDDRCTQWMIRLGVPVLVTLSGLSAVLARAAPGWGRRLSHITSEVEVDPAMLLPFAAIGAPGWTVLFLSVLRERLCRERKFWHPLLVYLSNVSKYLAPNYISVEVTLFMMNQQVYFGLRDLGLSGRYHRLVQTFAGLTSVMDWMMRWMMGQGVSQMGSRFLAVLLAAFWCQAAAFAASVVVSCYGHARWRAILLRGTTQRLLSKELQPILSLWTWCLACNCLAAVQALLVCSLLRSWQRPWQWLLVDTTLSCSLFLLAGPWRLADRPEDLWCWLGRHATSREELDMEALRELSRIAIRAEAAAEPWPGLVVGAPAPGAASEPLRIGWPVHHSPVLSVQPDDCPEVASTVTKELSTCTGGGSVERAFEAVPEPPDPSTDAEGESVMLWF